MLAFGAMQELENDTRAQEALNWSQGVRRAGDQRSQTVNDIKMQDVLSLFNQYNSYASGGTSYGGDTYNGGSLFGGTPYGDSYGGTATNRQAAIDAASRERQLLEYQRSQGQQAQDTAYDQEAFQRDRLQNADASNAHAQNVQNYMALNQNEFDKQASEYKLGRDKEYAEFTSQLGDASYANRKGVDYDYKQQQYKDLLGYMGDGALGQPGSGAPGIGQPGFQEGGLDGAPINGPPAGFQEGSSNNSGQTYSNGGNQHFGRVSNYTGPGIIGGPYQHVLATRQRHKADMLNDVAVSAQNQTATSDANFSGAAARESARMSGRGIASGGSTDVSSSFDQERKNSALNIKDSAAHQRAQVRSGTIGGLLGAQGADIQYEQGQQKQRNNLFKAVMSKIG